MPNYRYNAPEYARRNNCGRTAQVVGTPQVRVEQVKKPCCEERRECDHLHGMPLAMAYVPWQEWRKLYEVEKGFRCGTIFEELFMPFRGMGGCCK